MSGRLGGRLPARPRRAAGERPAPSSSGECGRHGGERDRPHPYAARCSRRDRDDRRRPAVTHPSVEHHTDVCHEDRRGTRPRSWRARLHDGSRSSPRAVRPVGRAPGPNRRSDNARRPSPGRRRERAARLVRDGRRSSSAPGQKRLARTASRGSAPPATSSAWARSATRTGMARSRGRPLRAKSWSTATGRESEAASP